MKPFIIFEIATLLILCSRLSASATEELPYEVNGPCPYYDAGIQWRRSWYTGITGCIKDGTEIQCVVACEVARLRSENNILRQLIELYIGMNHILSIIYDIIFICVNLK